jgi:pimeloyl-ACP methyl ester carboxylesterase
VRIAEACEEPAFAIGHSLGAAAITGASTRHKMRGIIHIGGVGVTFASRNRTLRAVSRLSLAWEPLLKRTRFTTRWAGLLTGTYFSAITDLGGYGMPIAGWVPRSMERDLLAERLDKGFDWTSIEVWMQMARWATGERPSYSEAFRNTDVPLLVLIGDRDPLVRRHDGEELMRWSGSQDRRLEVLDAYDTGYHWGHLDMVLGTHAPDVVWPMMLDWLDARA